PHTLVGEERASQVVMHRFRHRDEVPLVAAPPGGLARQHVPDGAGNMIRHLLQTHLSRHDEFVFHAAPPCGWEVEGARGMPDRRCVRRHCLPGELHRLTAHVHLRNVHTANVGEPVIPTWTARPGATPEAWATPRGTWASIVRPPPRSRVRTEIGPR